MLGAILVLYTIFSVVSTSPTNYPPRFAGTGATELRIDAAKERNSEDGIPAPPHRSELNEAVRRRILELDLEFRGRQIRLKQDS
jgi:hypothetical protein